MPVNMRYCSYINDLAELPMPGESNGAPLLMGAVAAHQFAAGVSEVRASLNENALLVEHDLSMGLPNEALIDALWSHPLQNEARWLGGIL